MQSCPAMIGMRCAVFKLRKKVTLCEPADAADSQLASMDLNDIAHQLLMRYVIKIDAGLLKGRCICCGYNMICWLSFIHIHRMPVIGLHCMGTAPVAGRH